MSTELQALADDITATELLELVGWAQTEAETFLYSLAMQAHASCGQYEAKLKAADPDSGRADYYAAEHRIYLLKLRTIVYSILVYRNYSNRKV